MSGVNADLLPCAFCGEMPRTHIFAGDMGGIQIDCMTPNCPASPITTGNALDDPLVGFTAWNRRPTPPAIDPKVTALVEAVKNTLTGYDEWANCASGTPEDTIATGMLFHRINLLRAALAAWEAQ